MKYVTIAILLTFILAKVVAAENYVLDLDGDGDYVEVADHDNLDITQQLTIEFKVMFREMGAENGRLVVKTWSRDVDPWIVYGISRLDRTRRVLFTVATEDGVGHDLYSTDDVLQMGRWVHIAGVYDGKAMSLYADGIGIATTPVTGKIATNDMPLVMGMNAVGDREPINGLIDEVRLWKVARAQEEIANNMGAPLSGKEPGLVAYWRFDGQGNTAVDATGNGHDGRFNGDAKRIDETVIVYPAVISDRAQDESGSLSVSPISD